MKRIVFTLLLLLTVFGLKAQVDDGQMLRKIYDEALVRGESYGNLRYLCKEIGPRLSGSTQAAAAVEWGRQLMKSYGFDTVYLQPVMVPHWVRGAKEEARAISPAHFGQVELNVTALGNSVGTGPNGVMAQVVEVTAIDELAKLGEKGLKGKIVFINQKMPNEEINTLVAYGKTGAIRSKGPSEAAKFGAVAVMIRSLATDNDDFPHTGSTSYQGDIEKIPAVALSTNDANKLSHMLEVDPGTKAYFRTNCMFLKDEPSYNVVGEIKGREFPDKIIAVGGHLDSWDLAEGAHDDGAGIVHSIEAIRLIKAIGYQPRNTLRAVLFMNEENGMKGGKEYAKVAEDMKENHVLALESDEGGFSPRGFSIEGEEDMVKKIQSWKPLFEPYGLYQIESGWGGVDIGPLKKQGVPLVGLMVDSQRYFRVHHSALDTFEMVDRRELELGSAALGALIYLVDQHGLDNVN